MSVFFYAAYTGGERGWEIGVSATRERVCADMREYAAKELCDLLNAAYALHKTYDIPATQIAAIWRIVKEHGGIPDE